MIQDQINCLTKKIRNGDIATLAFGVGGLVLALVIHGLVGTILFCALTAIAIFAAIYSRCCQQSIYALAATSLARFTQTALSTAGSTPLGSTSQQPAV